MTSKSATIDKLIPEMINLRKRGKTNREIASMLNISHTTVARRLANYGMDNNQKHVVHSAKKETIEQGAISAYDIMRVRNQIKIGQLIMCEVDIIDVDSDSLRTVKVLKNMYIIKKLMNGRGVLVGDNPDDTLGKLVTYVDIIRLRRRLKGKNK